MAGLYFFIMQLFPEPEYSGVTVEPQEANEGGTLYDLWFTSAEIYDLSVDHNLTGILFSTDQNMVSLLDQERKLRWDKMLSSTPRQAKLSSCGNYIIIGTSNGLLSFMAIDDNRGWEDHGLPVDIVAISPGAGWIAAARSDQDQEIHNIDLFKRDGQLKWRIESGEVENLYLSSEYLEEANVYFTHRKNETPAFSALDMEGNEMWTYENQTLAAVSRHGSRMAAYRDQNIIVYNLRGDVAWQTDLPFRVQKVMFNPQNYNRLLVYGNKNGAGDNLHYYDLNDGILWKKRVADGSLFTFTADGQYIVTSSWRHYREDYTRMVILDREGSEVNSWEVAMRVEKLVKSGHPSLMVVSGKDGYIDFIDLEPLLIASDNDLASVPIYNPVSIEQRENELKILLYFIDENANLVPVTRTVSESDNPLETALQELIRGPSRGSALYRTIPEKDATIGVDLIEEDGVLVLDFSYDPVNLNEIIQNMTTLESLVRTVSAFPRVQEIYLTIEGEKDLITVEDLELKQPLAPYRPKHPIYVPIMSGNRYYLLVREAERENEAAPGLQSLFEQSLRACRFLPFVPNDLELIDLRISREQIQINLNGSLKSVFPENFGKQEKLQAELLLDALFMTIFENTRTQRVEVLVEGQTWDPPAGYPSLSRFYRQPYYINPEQ